MIRFLLSIIAYLIANAVGLLIAAVLLPGFVINPLSFVVAVAIFSLVQTILGPLITKISFKSFPQLMGGIALVTIFVGLFVTEIFIDGMQIGGIANWLAATLLVWLGSLIASILLPLYVFTQLVDKAGENARG
ncbi:MAG TPA: phage holin family protein [Roseovarius sp.]|nr:phage holin family protein [Roseovarius sp.]